MHLISAHVKFAFGDRVRFDSPTQGRTGVGHVEAVAIYSDGRHDYMIALDEFDEFNIQPGILESEITFLDTDAE